nr:soluble calcium-activated nucleotidase 1-like isoform X2 [Procambarus clarkii]
MSKLSQEDMLEGSNMGLDMRQAVFSRTPLSYRVGNSTLHVQTSTYPLTAPIYSDRGYIKYRIAIVSDLDTNSKHPTEKDTWISHMKKGHLTVNIENEEVSVEWDKDIITLKSNMAHGGRGMELSELIVYNGKLYAVDDRTGIIYEIDLHQHKAIPWVILPDGSGREIKGFKSEWATVKDETLIVGGLGKEWTTSTGELVNHNPQWVKTVTTHGFIEHHDWTKNYEKLRESVGIFFPGYMIHESCAWSERLQRWVFLPRRASSTRYDENEDEHRGTDIMLKATEGFEKIEVKHVGEIIDTHGFSSFKFIPGTKDNIIVALKSEEVNGQVASYIMAFNLAGKVLLPETKIGNYKFEGIEFV